MRHDIGAFVACKVFTFEGIFTVAEVEPLGLCN